MKRFSLFSVCYVVACAAGYFGILAAANARADSSVRFIVESLGYLYGTLLYVAGMLALYIVSKSIKSAESAGQVAIALPVAVLPAMIGTIGMVHGYIEVHYILALSGTYPKPSDMFYAHATVLIRLLVGICFTMIPFTMIAIAVLPYGGRRNVGGYTENGA